MFTPSFSPLARVYSCSRLANQCASKLKLRDKFSKETKCSVEELEASFGEQAGFLQVRITCEWYNDSSNIDRVICYDVTPLVPSLLPGVLTSCTMLITRPGPLNRNRAWCRILGHTGDHHTWPYRLLLVCDLCTWPACCDCTAVCRHHYNLEFTYLTWDSRVVNMVSEV